MVLDIARGHIKVGVRGRVVTVPGEMFFPPNEKVGFAIFERQIKNWDSPSDSEQLTSENIEEVIECIRQEFSKGGHTLEVE